MKLLLDTHTFIWWHEGDPRLSERAAELIRDESNLVRVSLASVWEMQIKIQLGRLRLLWPLPHLLQVEQHANRIRVLPIVRDDIFMLSHFPLHHRDPFDRLIAAQALRRNYQVVTHDPMFAPYGVPVVW